MKTARGPLRGTLRVDLFSVCVAALAASTARAHRWFLSTRLVMCSCELLAFRRLVPFVVLWCVACLSTRISRGVGGVFVCQLILSSGF